MGMMLQQERKMKMRKAFSLAWGLALSLVVCTAAAASAAEKGAEERVIRVATPGNYAPFTMYDELTQKWSGFEIDMWHAIDEKVTEFIVYLSRLLSFPIGSGYFSLTPQPINSACKIS